MRSNEVFLDAISLKKWWFWVFNRQAPKLNSWLTHLPSFVRIEISFLLRTSRIGDGIGVGRTIMRNPASWKKIHSERKWQWCWESLNLRIMIFQKIKINLNGPITIIQNNDIPKHKNQPQWSRPKSWSSLKVCCFPFFSVVHFHLFLEMLYKFIQIAFTLFEHFWNICVSISWEAEFIRFYRTQVNLGSDLWVRMSVRPSVRKWDTFVKLNWCDSGWWRYQVNTNW